MSKIYFYDMVSQEDMPVFLVAYNDIKMPIDSSLDQLGVNGQIGQEDIVLNYVFGVVKSMKDLQKKCKKCVK